MRILVLEWDSFAHEYIVEEFERAGCLIEHFSWPFGNAPMRENMELCQKLMCQLKAKNYHFVFSLNFFPVAAKACNLTGTKYVSWVYDSPYMLLYSKHILYQTNQVYLFDKSLCEEFRKHGVNNVYYLPMAAPVKQYDSLNEKAKERTEYQAAISFVGSIYTEDRQDFFKYLEKVGSYTAGYLRAAMNAQKDVYGAFILEDMLSDNIVEELQKVCPIKRESDEWESDAWIYANYFLARKLTGEQRTEILELLSRNYEVKLYSPEEASALIKVENNGPVDYVNEMPLVFKNTKINLNMTLRSIHSGIPLRAMDIMGCGGFLLTNYQEDFLEFFEPDVDFVYYSDNADLLRKVEYYTTHDEERQAIARNGYEKVKAAHTYGHRVKTILDNVMSEEEKQFNDTLIECEKLIEEQGGVWSVRSIKYEELSDEELVNITEEQMKSMHIQKDAFWKLRNSLLTLTNRELLAGEWYNYDNLIDYYKNNVVDTMFTMFPEMYYVKVFLRIYEKEKELGMPVTLQKFTSYQQIREMYLQIIFFLRRIENDLDMDLQKELLKFMQENGISIFVVQYVLNSSMYINAELVKAKISKLFN